MPDVLSDTHVLKREMESHYWWHTIDLGNGLVTPGRLTARQIAHKQKAVFGDIDLTNKSVLDVGAWTGAYSIEAKRRGAARVVAIDHFTWNDPKLRGRAAFDFAVKCTGLEVEAIDIDLAIPQSLSGLESFDIVLFLGVFYHLLDPIHVLQQLARITREVLVVESHIADIADPRPAMVFYPNNELDGDPTNWWGPNAACLDALLRTLGFKELSIPSIGPGRAIIRARR
jgi:tRNA (mo5U34)-methyltransferase